MVFVWFNFRIAEQHLGSTSGIDVKVRTGVLNIPYLSYTESKLSLDGICNRLLRDVYSLLRA